LSNASLFLTAVVDDNTRILDPRMNTSPELLAASLNNAAEFIIRPYHRSTDIIIRFIMKAMTKALLPSASACDPILSIPSAQRYKGHCGH
jgi:hypothetical protein